MVSLGNYTPIRMAVAKSLDFNNVKGLHLTHINIRSLYNTMDIVRQTIFSSEASIVALSETWLNSNITSAMIEIPGYTCTRNDRSWLENGNIKRGGGVCCYIKSDICFSDTEYANLNRSTKDIVTTVPLSVCYGGAKPLGPWVRTSNFIPCE